MIKNRLVFPGGNDLKFTIDHTEDGEKYTLPINESYYIMIEVKSGNESETKTYTSTSADFSVSVDLEPGIYAFELGILGNKKRIISPAYDERRRMLNQLIILENLH